ncbi:hypothetical protein [Rhodoplanes roseus]|nr:hypothetical protein [Rhodoplanes roseus]
MSLDPTPVHEPEHLTPNSILACAMTARGIGSPAADLAEAIADAALLMADLDTLLRRRHPGGPDRAASLDAPTRALWRRARRFLSTHMPAALSAPLEESR